MPELSDILNDNVEFEFAGKTWTFRKISLGTMADFETAMSMRKLRQALKALGDEASAIERAELVRAMQTQTGPGVFESDAQTVTGMRLLLYLSLKPNHPELTEDDVGRMMSIQHLDEVQSLLDILSGPTEKDDGRGNGQDAAAVGPP